MSGRQNQLSWSVLRQAAGRALWFGTAAAAEFQRLPTFMKQQIIRLIEKRQWFKPFFDYYRALRTAKSDLFFYNSQIAPDGLPIPTPVLLVSTTGSADHLCYLDGGLKAKESILDALNEQGIDISKLPRILDFGCGCGRVLRHWRNLDHVDVHGVDIDSRAVKWCNRNLSFCNVRVSGLVPPLLYPADHFSFIYALSVLTHLPEHLQKSWLKEWQRVLSPNGILVFSLHGDYYRSSLTDSEREIYDSGYLVVRNAGSAGTNRCGAFHPPEYAMQHLTEGFELLKHIPRGARGNPQQDLYLLRKSVA